MSNDDLLLLDSIYQATRRAVIRLFYETGESFYYFTLATTGGAHAPVASAWSREKLALIPEDEKQDLKWSYADSPYYDFGADLFDEVRRLFSLRPDISRLQDEDRWIEYEARLSIMELALRKLDDEGLFGRGDDRGKIVINAEVMPPDFTNTERAMRLNPASALRDWLREAAE